MEVFLFISLRHQIKIEMTVISAYQTISAIMISLSCKIDEQDENIVKKIRRETA